MNRLAKEQSVYLRHAALQKIDWYPWSEAAFAAARDADKPVFLSAGAAWCHWCHVMAKESFEDPETARILNEGFISIKLDRDERPDVDRRYQQAVAAMGGGSGWPLSVFLTPDKKPFFGGTYFPPHAAHGRPGFKEVLKAVRSFYTDRKNEAVSFADSVLTSLEPGPYTAGHPGRGLLDSAEQDILAQFDPVHGGFGSSPKFPAPGAIEFLLRRSMNEAGARAAGAVRATLLAMARGGIHDRLAGGFHRYSVDEAWIVPHFEKMADDNAGLLRNYIEAYAVLGDPVFQEAASGIIQFTGRELADPEGGFYASQDADVTPDDEGGYFTWSAGEMKEALMPDEYEAVSRHFLHPRSRMHHDSTRMVLAVHMTPEEIAGELALTPEETARLIASAEKKLLAKRKTRKAPPIDRTLYTSLNGMMIGAWFRAFPVLNDVCLRDFAAKSLDRILRERYAGGSVSRVEGVPGLLEDHVHLIEALLCGYEATARSSYLDAAQELAAVCMEKFFDHANGGFFDTEGDVLGTRLKRIEDVPYPSANSVAIGLLLKLWQMTGTETYRREAERSLGLFAGHARGLGVHAGTFFAMLHAYHHDSTLQVEAPPEGSLAESARAAAVKSYSALRYGVNQGRIISCRKGVCSAPFTRPEDLAVLFMK